MFEAIEVLCLKKRLVSLVICLFLLIGLFSVNLLIVAADDTDFTVDVPYSGTFLRAEPFEGAPTGGSTVEDPAIIDLINKGFKEGDYITISYSGKLYGGAYWDSGDLGESNTEENYEINGLFSTSNELESVDILNRVPGAIDFGEDIDTGETWFQNIPTDIEEDFIIEPYTGKTIQIPSNAKYLFICKSDSFYPDNVGTISISLKMGNPPTFPVEFLAIIVLAIIALVILFFFVKKRKKQ